MKTETVEVRMQPDEKKAFKDAAKLAGVPLSAWIRERLRRAAIRDLTEAGQQVEFLQSFSRRSGE